MIFNLVRLVALTSIALAAPSSSPLEGPVTMSLCKASYYQDFCCDDIIDNDGSAIELFGSSPENVDSLVGFACRPLSAINPTCARGGHHLCCTADTLRGFFAFGCQKIIS